MSTFQSLVARLDFKNILFATDFSSVSEIALPYVTALARRYGAAVLFAHVYPPESTYEVPMVVSPGTPHNRDAAEEEMSAFLQEHDLTSIRHKAVVRAGDVWLELSDLIAGNNIDLIVMGSHGRKGLRGLLLGSVAEQVIRRATCPVLTVTPLCVSPPQGEFRQILYATDFSSASQTALTYALSLAQESDARLTLLHVIDEPVIDVASPCPEAQYGPARELLDTKCVSARQRLRALLPSATTLWCEPELLIEVGPAAERVLHTAEVRSADLIVMGARHSRMPHASAHVPWHTVHRVLCDARCPVLTVRE